MSRTSAAATRSHSEFRLVVIASVVASSRIGAIEQETSLFVRGGRLPVHRRAVRTPARARRAQEPATSVMEARFTAPPGVFRGRYEWVPGVNAVLRPAG